ncbi:hypothetical protein DW952_07275 [Ruminococcus sp. AM44-9AT]|nr:hypothetical protein DW952_07275 [Ruminococcus sp. AM44-9AT]
MNCFQINMMGKRIIATSAYLYFMYYTAKVSVFLLFFLIEKCSHFRHVKMVTGNRIAKRA